jgi:hypothetical protein
VAHLLLRYDDEGHWLRFAAKQAGHLFPPVAGPVAVNERLKNAAQLMEVALRWLAACTPGTAEMLRLMDATPVPCGHPVITARRSDLACCAGHSRWHWRSKLLLMFNWLIGAPVKRSLIAYDH